MTTSTELSPSATPYSGQYLEIFNPEYRETYALPQFSKLLPELRWMVWEQALRRERYIRVELKSVSNVNDISNGHWPHHYAIVVVSKAISKLFSVSSESRRVARGFYRVQLPCHYFLGRWTLESRPMENNGIFYFNPELDMLEISGMEYFADFARRIWDQDKRQVGLVNLALDGFETRQITRLGSTSQQDIHLARRFLSKLERVFFVSRESSPGRIHVTISQIRNSIAGYIHRSHPLMSYIPTFDRVGCDPRPIKIDLAIVLLLQRYARDTANKWQTLLNQWQVQCHGGQVEYRFMLTCGEKPEDERILDRSSATRAVQQENGVWRRLLQQIKDSGMSYQAIDETAEELKQAPRTAVGFWLFPIESLGLFPTFAELTGHPYFPRRFRREDLSNYRPELCLFHVP
ncbi:hypothetical protein NM208_g13481 [Fusarium decemcellulare]|uniref:Uncharacterized protein n=1 Tax=Fusarium decemcellulare TaxID=57161 RepID=A0ACC1RKW2_9HYPO|nr:hypothetical protein NM208_g13481 [Fusarium decemcellulare]